MGQTVGASMHDSIISAGGQRKKSIGMRTITFGGSTAPMSGVVNTGKDSEKGGSVGSVPLSPHSGEVNYGYVDVQKVEVPSHAERLRIQRKKRQDQEAERQKKQMGLMVASRKNVTEKYGVAGEFKKC